MGSVHLQKHTIKRSQQQIFMFFFHIFYTQFSVVYRTKAKTKNENRIIDERQERTVEIVENNNDDDDDCIKRAKPL